MVPSIKHVLMPAALLAAAAFAAVGAQGPAPKYKRDLPAKLLAQAKVKEVDAAQKAQAKYPTARIQAVELENENGNLIYSYELKVAGHSGIEEVNVNAKTGAVVNTEHEGPNAERNEAKRENGKNG
ncbi:MAG: PepSY domain-containing protein [Gemmatimonadales bacterium]